ncbi:ankyrin repeat protein, partial [Aureobasidium melanogenum]
MSNLDLRREQYTVGWVCALPTEATAAQAMLDETYPALLSTNTHNSNVYIFGRVCNHKVVIATLPSGSYGTTSAATTAKEMLLDFPKIRFGLLVGIGGGIPNEEKDIRLGDVVVSKPQGTIGGVLQFDLGKETNEGFERTGTLNRPPDVLLKAIAILESRHALRRSIDVPRYISEAYEKFPDYEADHPGPEQDRLFEAEYDHVPMQAPTCKRCDLDRLVDRKARKSQSPVIHYGLIGSGNQVIKNSHRKIYLILDALDEFGVDRQDLLEWIESIAEFASSKVHLLVTSRKESDIESSLGRTNIMDQIIAVQTDIIDEDICTYVKHRLQTDKGFQRWSNRDGVQQMIQDSLMRMSGGMFRWAACQLDSLSKCVNRLALEKALKSLPPTLDDTYSRMLQSIPKEQRDDTIRLLQLLAYSDEPLDLKEAVDAIAVNITDAERPFFEPDYRTPIPSDIIISCSSLVMIERVDQISHDNYRQVLQLAHFSVQQYLKSDNVDPSWKDFLSEPHAKASNAKLCLAYCFELDRYGIEDDGLDYDDEYLEQRPFTNTAAVQWTQYAVQVEAQDGRLLAMIGDFLLSDKRERARLNWLRLRDAEDNLVPNREWYTEWFRESPEKLFPLTIASACGLYHSVKSLLLRDTDPNECCSVWGSALYAASYGGHVDIVRLLLDHGARPNMRAGQAELSIAISSPNSTQRFEIVQALLQHVDDVNVCDELVGLPLVQAAARGDEQIVNTLLERGAHVDAIDNQQKNALRVAAAYGDGKIVRKLLEHKADVNSIGNPIGSALSSACYWGHEEIVRTLLDHGANVCQQFHNHRYENALEATCQSGHEAIFCLLIEHFVESSLHLGKGALNKCLVLACASGHDNLVKLLLERRLDVNVHHSRFGSPLLTASEFGHEEAVRLLLRHGADVHQAWQFGRLVGVHALYLACGGGHEGIVKLLLDHGADVNTQGGDLDTALMMACFRGHERLVELLLTQGANISQVGDAYGTALILACVQRRESVVKTLLAHGADLDQAATSSRDWNDASVSRTPLLHLIAAASPFHTKMSENEAAWLRILGTLMAAGADLNKTDDQGRTPLHYAAVSRSSELTKILVGAGALLDEVDEDGQTPLISAAEIKAEGRVEIFLNAGAKTDIQDCDGRTALHHAADRGWLEVCIMLVEAGANLNILDRQGHTPLQLAEQEDHTEVVTFLLQKEEK